MTQVLVEARVEDLVLNIFGTLPRLPPGVYSAALPVASARWVRPTMMGLVRQPNPREKINRSIKVAQTSGLLVDIDGESYPGPVLFESVTYDIYLEGPPAQAEAKLETDAPGLLRHIRTFSGPSERSLSHYRLEIGDDVGTLGIDVVMPERTLARLELEIYPRKLDYRTDYVDMLADITAIAPALVFDAAGRTSISSKLAAGGRQTAAEWYEILRSICSEFLLLVDQIGRDPQRRLDLIRKQVPIERARRIKQADFEAALRRPGLVVNAPKHLAVRLMPSRVVEQAVAPDYDAEGNRYLRWLIKSILMRLNRLEGELRELVSDRWETKGRVALRDRWSKEISWLRPQLQSRLSYDWLSACNEPRNLTPSATLQAHPLYGRAFELGRCLLRSLRADADRFTQIGSRSVSRLYEYWCFLAIVKLIRRDARLIQSSDIQMNFQGSTLSLKKGREAAVVFQHRTTGRQFQVYYNRQYQTPTISQRPDATLHIETDDGIHVFDAKYRIQFDEGYASLYGGVGPMVDDISTMHRYRDAIVTSNLGGYERIVSSACVLFPLNPLGDFREHAFFRSLQEVGVGGLPFLPASTGLVAARLEKIIHSAVGT